jgi:hypothetical protein
MLSARRYGRQHLLALRVQEWHEQRPTRNQHEINIHTVISTIERFDLLNQWCRLSERRLIGMELRTILDDKGNGAVACV